MPEETEQSEVVGGGGLAGADAAALALALGVASTASADAFLAEQTALSRLQAEKLRHELPFEHSHLRWRRFEDRMKGATRLMLVAVGAVLLCAIAAAMWEASQAEGLVVDAFSVPPAFAANGITADVLAGDLTTRLAAIRDFANEHSLAHSNDVSQDRNQEVKVEIPETGIFLAQAWRYLKLWLGHERRLTGNLRDMGNGKIALVVALDGRDAFAIQGAATDLDRLEDQAAKKVFAQVDPTNYVLYLDGKGRDADSLAAAARLPQLTSTPAEMSNAYSLWSGITFYLTDNLALAIERSRISISVDPKTTAGYFQMMRMLVAQGHDEEALVQAREIATKRKEDEPAWRNSDGVEYAKLLASDVRNTATGNFQNGLFEPCYGRCYISPKNPIGAELQHAEYAARLHDQKLSRTLIASTAAKGPASPVQQQRTAYFAAVAGEDWPTALASARAYVHSWQQIHYASRTRNLLVATQAMPWLAYALARTGDFSAAHRAVDGTPGDCYLCLDIRGDIDALQKNWGGARYWFARAVSASPSSVFAYADWGAMLLAQGKPDEAIEKFKLSNQKGPHFADAWEGWGEALMAKNQSHLALAKFAEAEKYAPNWGRLHLKWGEALFYANKKDEARKQFSRAAQLDLTPGEKAELARQSPHA